MKNWTLIFALFTISISWGQQNNFTQTKDSLVQSTNFVNYQWNSPSIELNLSHVLSEVSGISVINDSLFACIDDEHGVLYIYNFNSESIVSQIPFGEPGDYEGVAFANEIIYVLRSDGELFEISDFNSINPKISHFPSNVPSLDNEGLFYDSINNNLLIACKGKFGKGIVNQYRREVHIFDLTNKVHFDDFLFNIDIFSAAEFALSKGLELPTKLKNDSVQTIFKVRMSGLAMHPITRDVYILSAFDNAILIFSEAGYLKHIELFDSDLYPRPEGISFQRNGNLIISNENKKTGGTIIVLKPVIP